MTLACEYSSRKPTSLLPAVFGLFLLGVGIWVMSSARAAQSPVFLGPAFLLFGVFLLFVSGVAWTQASNERIVISDGRITWTDWRGNIKVACRVEDVITGTFRVRQSVFGDRGPRNSDITLYVRGTQSRLTYSVGTRAGEIRWNFAISHLDELNAEMRSLAGQTDAPSGKASGPGWDVGLR